MAKTDTEMLLEQIETILGQQIANIRMFNSGMAMARGLPDEFSFAQKFPVLDAMQFNIKDAKDKAAYLLKEERARLKKETT